MYKCLHTDVCIYNILYVLFDHDEVLANVLEYLNNLWNWIFIYFKKLRYCLNFSHSGWIKLIHDLNYIL